MITKQDFHPWADSLIQDIIVKLIQVVVSVILDRIKQMITKLIISIKHMRANNL